jgi:hypothetical protein
VRRRIGGSFFASVAVAALPLACALPEPRVDNPFIGTWAVAEADGSITFRPDTVVQNTPNGPGVALDDATCRGVFRFAYAEKSRDALTGLVPRQPELRGRLLALLVAPDYRVAELTCDQGDQTYVLVDPRQLVAIYRDGDIAGVERLARR